MTEKTQLRVQKLRLQHGWSQEQLAELSGLSVRTIQRLEQGRGASAETLKAVAAVFDVDFNTLRENAMTQSDSGTISKDEELAFRKVRAIKKFYLRTAVYVIIAVVLTIYNLVSDAHYFWAGWVVFGLALALFCNGLKVFDKVPFLNGAWEKAQAEKYLGRKL